MRRSFSVPQSRFPPRQIKLFAPMNSVKIQPNYPVKNAFLIENNGYLVADSGNFFYLCSMELQKKLQVVYMQDARDFIKSLPIAARKKIYYNVVKIEGGVMDCELFKKLDGYSDLWELRSLYNGMQYRLLAFWDEQEKRLVVATHGFIKKTWKVPAKEIAKAEAQRKKYYEAK